MLEAMPATLFDRWVKYFNAEPWGLEVQDLHFGHLFAAIINPHLKKGAKALTAMDGRLFKEEKPRQTEEEMKLAAMRLTALHGAAQKDT